MAPGDKRMLVDPLTRSTKAGRPYRRPSAVEAQLLDVLTMSEAEVTRRAGIVDRSSPDALKDECLVHLARVAVRDGDAARFTLATGTLLRRHVGRMRRRFRGLGVRPDAVDDLCHAVVQKVMEAIVAEDGRGDFYEMRFGRVLKCRVLNEFEKYRLGQDQAADHDSLSDPVGDEEEGDGAMREEVVASPGDAAVDAERRMLIAGALGSIANPKHREVFVLHHYEGWPIEAGDPNDSSISALYGVSPRTVNNWLNAAKRDLAAWRAARGGSHA